MRRYWFPLALLLAVAVTGRADATTYTIEVQSSPGGTVTPAGDVQVPAGGSQTFTFTPSGCLKVGAVTVDDVPVGTGITEYTFTNVQADHILYVPFGAGSTTTTLDVLPTHGQCAVPETLTAAVPGGDGGEVQFYRDGSSIGTRPVSGGAARYVLAGGLPSGSYTFSASFLGTSCLGSSDSPVLSYDVADTGPTPVTLELALAPVNNEVSATTTLRIGGVVAPRNGQVTYYDGATPIGTVAMGGGHSSTHFFIASPTLHVITAVAYLSLCPATAITSPPESLDYRTPTGATLSILPDAVEAGMSVLLTANVGPPNATGTIRFRDITNGVDVGSTSLVSGEASLEYGPLSGSSRTMQAIYEGDGAYRPCSSGPVSLQIISTPPAPPVTPADTALWVTNGRVSSIAADGGTIYIGGQFDYCGPATGGGVAIDRVSGAPLQPFPKVVGVVRAVAPDGAGGWYLGGTFTSVRGRKRNNLAHLDASGRVTDWDPNANATVNALAVSGSTVYVGGSFVEVGAQLRVRLAALDAVTGAPTAWRPRANNTVNVLVVSGGRVYAGGTFNRIDGQVRNHLAAIDAGTGDVTAWAPDVQSADAFVADLAVSGGVVYVAGQFDVVNGSTRHDLAAIDVASGAVTAWDPNVGPLGNPHGDAEVYCIALSGSTAFIGGAFSTVGGQPRSCLAAIDLATGIATSWNPGANNSVNRLAPSGTSVYIGGRFTLVAGQSRHYLAELDATSGAATPWDPHASDRADGALAVQGSQVFAGGLFTSVGGVTRHNIAALDASGGGVTAWNPNADGGVNAVAVHAGTVYAGGWFGVIGGQPRSAIAALDVASGAATLWNAAADSTVSALAVADGVIYAGGYFTHVGGQARSHVAALDLAAGTATAWNPGADDYVAALMVNGGTVYAGGLFSAIGGQLRSRVAALDPVTGAATSWNPGADDRVFAFFVDGGTIYAGGPFTSIGGQSRHGLAALDAVTGAALAWNPNANDRVIALAKSERTLFAGGWFSNIGVQPRNRGAALDPQADAVTAWNPDANAPDAGAIVQALTVSGGKVYAGGYFTSIGGQPQSGIAAFALDAATTSVPAPVEMRTELALVSANPSVAGARIRYGVARTGRVRLEVLDVSGRVEATLVDAIQAAGLHAVTWDGAGRQGRLVPGVHFVRLAAAGRTSTTKLAIVR